MAWLPSVAGFASTRLRVSGSTETGECQAEIWCGSLPFVKTLGLRTVIYHVPDLKRAKEWYGRRDSSFASAGCRGGDSRSLGDRSVWQCGGAHREPALRRPVKRNDTHSLEHRTVLYRR